MMDKSELLFQMMEHPERYSDEQWCEVLADEECKELYTMLSMVRSAIDDERIGGSMSDELINLEWDKFRAKHEVMASGSSPRWPKIAAAVAIVVLCFGLAIAAVYSHVFEKQAHDGKESTATLHVTSTPESGALPDQEVHTDELQSFLYDNVPLEQIISDLSSHYDVDVEWRSDEARDLRLYYKWEPSFTLDKVVDMLNSFEAINITREGDKIIIEQAGE
jgi:hypothetical protein